MLCTRPPSIDPPSVYSYPPTFKWDPAFLVWHPFLEGDPLFKFNLGDRHVEPEQAPSHDQTCDPAFDTVHVRDGAGGGSNGHTSQGRDWQQA
jgi:hypothetical protein